MKILKTYENLDCTKMLIQLQDKYVIENCFKFPFWMCITTQVGCPVGCKFCHSGKHGFRRNLTKDEMLAQIELAIKHSIGLDSSEVMFSSVSFTGMGEPLLNIDAVLNTIRAIQHNSNIDISLTTTGIPHNLQKIFFAPQKISIDISAHAMFHKKRSQLIPAEIKYPLNNTLKFLLKYKNRFNKITIDYLLLSGINDTPDDLVKISELLKDTGFAIELKKYNRISNDDPFERSEDKVFEIFADYLLKNGINVTIEENVGTEFGAGCGQLVWSYSRDK